MAAKPEKALLHIGGCEVAISNPGKVYFPLVGVTKLEVAQYYLAVAEGALRGAGGRPNVLVRYVDGIAEAPFWQKRAPEGRPEWLETVALSFPSGLIAEEIVPREAAALAWMVNLGCIELHPHPVRADDVEHPDEFRVDLDPVPGVEWPQLREVARVVRATLADHGLLGWPKTSGSRGIHVNVHLHRRWTFAQVRRAALALAREVERHAPTLATSKWWKEERHGVFIDYSAFSFSSSPRPSSTAASTLARSPSGESARRTSSPKCSARHDAWASPRSSPPSAGGLTIGKLCRKIAIAINHVQPSEIHRAAGRPSSLR